MTTEVGKANAIGETIAFVRGRRVIPDADLAALYGVPTRRLNEQVKRNPERFPEDFCFVLTREELADLRSHFATSSGSHGGRCYLPFAFTEHGAIMAAGVLNSPQAVEMSLYVVRAFIRMREMLMGYKELAARLEAVERKLDGHDEDIRALALAVRQLMAPPLVETKEDRFCAGEPVKGLPPLRRRRAGSGRLAVVEPKPGAHRLTCTTEGQSWRRRSSTSV